MNPKQKYIAGSTPIGVAVCVFVVLPWTASMVITIELFQSSKVLRK